MLRNVGRSEATSRFYIATLHANRRIDLELASIESNRGLGLTLTETEKREYRDRKLRQLVAESPYLVLRYYL